MPSGMVGSDELFLWKLLGAASLNNLYRRNEMEPSRRAAARSELDAKMEEFYSRGGKVTKCAPGPTDGTVTGKFNRRRDKTSFDKKDIPGTEESDKADKA